MKLLSVFLLFAIMFSTSSDTPKNSLYDFDKRRLYNQILLLKNFIRNNNYNDSVGFLIDMNIQNGKKRFFVINLLKDSVIASGLCAHGNGKSLFYSRDAVFSNKESSYCSSQGKYRIGKKYSGKFGKAYYLYGLDSSNSNAFKRSVVLHAHSCVPDDEVYPSFICNSLGCPTVSKNFLEKLSPFIDESQKPLLLWIFK